MHEHTEIIKQKGWTVELACEHWGISMRTYYRYVNNLKYKQRLLDMCKGLEDK